MAFKWITNKFRTKQAREKIKIAEDMLFGKGNSEIDQRIAESTARLTEALCKNSTQGVVDAGAFIFAKIKQTDGTFAIYSKRLSINDRMMLNDQPQLLDDPSSLLSQLSLRKITESKIPIGGVAE